MKNKIKAVLERFKGYSTENKFICVMGFVTLFSMFAILIILLKNYISVIAALAVVWVVCRMESGKPILPQSADTSACASCSGCACIYEAILPTIYEAMQTSAPLLNIKIPPTDKQIVAAPPPCMDGLPRCSFRMMKTSPGNALDNDTVQDIIETSVDDAFGIHRERFGCSVQGLFIDDVRQDDISMTITVMPHCAGITDQYIRQKRMKRLNQRQQQPRKEECIYDDTL